MFSITTRQAKLVKLMSENHKYHPAKFYAMQLKVSERTIFNDLSKIENYLENYDISIEKKPNKGIKLTGNMVSSGYFSQLINSTLKEDNENILSTMDRQLLIVKWLLLENKTLTYYSLSLELFCSTSVINKDLEHLKYFLDDEVSLISDSKGTRLEGSEIGIQKALKKFIYYILDEGMHQYTDNFHFHHLESLFDKNVIYVVENVIDELNSVLSENYSEQYLRSLFIFLLILTERSRKGFKIEYSPGIEWESKETLSNYPLAAQISNSISSELDFSFKESEIRHISIHLFAHRVEVKLNNKYIERLLEQDIKDIISNVSDTMKIDFNTDKKLYDSLTYHMFPLIYRLKANVEVPNPLLNEIKNNYSILFQMVWYAVEKFENKYDIKLSDNEVTFITIYFQSAIERKIQIRQVLVVCQTGIVTSDLIMNRIKNLLPMNINFTLIAKNDLENEDISDVDFIISSVKLSNPKKPIIYVSPLIKENDLLNIYSYYLKYSSKNNINNKNNMITKNSFIDHKYIFLNEKLTSKEECLKRIIGTFEKDGIVSGSFKKTVRDREELGNTNIQGLIATPHGNKSEVYTSKIAIMLTEKPVKWNRESSVSLIVLLAITEKDIVYVRELLSQFFRNIISIVSMDKYLAGISTSEELIQLFSVEDRRIH